MFQTRFQTAPEIYEEFLDILHAYQQKRTIEEVYARVQQLFKGHQDLLDEFSYFLPDNSGNAGQGAAKGKAGKKGLPVRGKAPVTTSGPGGKIVVSGRGGAIAPRYH